MKNKGSFIASEIDMDYRRDKRMKKKAMMLKKLRDNKTGIVTIKEENNNASKKN